MHDPLNGAACVTGHQSATASTLTSGLAPGLLLPPPSSLLAAFARPHCVPAACVPAGQAVADSEGVPPAARCTCAQPRGAHLPLHTALYACLPAGADQVNCFQVGARAIHWLTCAAQCSCAVSWFLQTRPSGGAWWGVCQPSVCEQHGLCTPRHALRTASPAGAIRPEAAYVWCPAGVIG